MSPRDEPNENGSLTSQDLSNPNGSTNPSIPLEECVVPPPDTDVDKVPSDSNHTPFTPSPTKGPDLVGRVSYFQLYRHADRTAWLLMAAGSLTAGVAGCTRPLMTLIFAGLVDGFTDYTKGQIARDKFEHLLEEHVLYFVYLAIGMFITSYLQMVCWDLSSARQTNLIRTLYLQSILRQSRSFFDTHNAGELSSRLTSDIELIQNGTGEKVGMFVQASCTFIAALVIAFVQSWRVSLVLCGLFPFMGVCNVVCNRLAARYGIAALKAYAEANNVVEESLSSIRTLMSIGGEPRAARDFAKRLRDAERLGVKKAKAQGMGIGGVQTSMFLAYSIAFFYGSYLIVGGLLTPGQLVAVYFALVIGTMRMSSVAPEIAAFGNACSAAYAIFHLIDREPDIAKPRDPTSQPLVPNKIEGRIRFDNVDFIYPSRPSVKVLDHVSFDVEPGQTVALVGQSGSGKSTSVALLERWYEPSSGTISIDGHELRDLSLPYLRSQIGLVSQEPVLFDLSIAENVSLGAPESSPPPTRAQIIEACKLSNAHGFIEKLPEGYDTLVGERGALLSGGQKQRIAIARALIRNPKILLLDEATSALDSGSERLVQEALERASVGRTTVVVAHRLSTIRNADKIIVMERGKIVEVGNHNELVELNGVYRRLVDMQRIVKEGDDSGMGKESSSIESADEVVRQYPAGTDIESDRPSAPRRRRSSLSKRDSGDIETGSVVISEVDAKPVHIYHRLLSLNRPQLPKIVLGVIAAIFGGAIFPVYAIIYGYILEVFTLTDLHEMRRQANHWASGFLVIALTAGLSNFSVQYLFGSLGEHMTTHLRTLSFTALLNQEVGYFDREENRTGILVSRIATDAARVNVLIGTVLGTLVQLAVNILGGLVVGLVVSWKVTVVTMGCIPLLIFAGMMQMTSLKGFGAKTKKAYHTSSHIAIQSISSHSTVISLGRESTFLQKYNQALADPIRATHRQAFVTGLGYAASNGLGFLANALAFWWGGRLFVRGEIGMREMFTVMIAVVFGSMASGRASGFAPDIAKAKSAAKSIFSILDRVPQTSSGPLSPHTLPSLTIEFRKIWFAYPTRPTHPVLRDISLLFSPGKTIALVGGSGSGKSTTIQLLERFYEPSQGEILVGGKPLKDIDLREWREVIGYVGQEPVLFEGSIRENIAFGSLSYRRKFLANNNGKDIPTLGFDSTMEEEITHAAKLSNAHDFITSLPMGYSTPVGSHTSIQLSGGQRQRIAIARALIQNPSILLLDEATSALDSESEQLVQQALDVARKGRTTIVVAHRLSTVRDADEILVLENGSVVERGNHGELVERGGVYSALVGMQRL